MDDRISFCIASANNEKEYTKLLLKSLKDHTNINDHEIIIFIDSDNQNTYEDLNSMRSEFPTMRIFRNTSEYPIGSQRNVSLMFHAAKNEIVCYLQSDMVVSKDFDKVILENMVGRSGVIMSVARIEPPLHPASPDKIIMNFGTDPTTFSYDAFNEFVDEQIAQNHPDRSEYFVPTIVHKKTWFDVLGGFDTQFRCSREDSDLILRAKLANLKLLQSWKIFIYHFTCVSSRGKDWFKNNPDSKYKNTLQQLADNEEVKRFIRKWGFFGHDPKPVYNTALFIKADQFVDTTFLRWVEPFFKVLYIDDQYVVEHLKNTVEFDSIYYSNLRWSYPTQHWHNSEHLFNQESLMDHIRYGRSKIEIEHDHDVVVSVDYSELMKDFDQTKQSFIQNINNFVTQNGVGQYNIGCFDIDIKSVNDISSSYIKFDKITRLLDDSKFVFE